MANKTLSYGSSGDEVKKLQKALNDVGFSLDVDGKFGSKTQSAVKSYQQNNGLSVDGIVGVNTWNSLSKNAQQVTTTNKTQTEISKNTIEKNKTPETKTRPKYQKSETVISAEKILQSGKIISRQNITANIQQK